MNGGTSGWGSAATYDAEGELVGHATSSLAIVAYGFAPQLLYVGIVLALASPIAVAYTFRRELND